MGKRDTVVLLVLALIAGGLALSIEWSGRPVEAANLPARIEQGTRLPQGADGSGKAYLIQLPMPAVEEMRADGPLTPEQAQAYARRLSQRAAAPLLSDLERLRQQGQVAGYALRPELYAIAVELAAGAGPVSLPQVAPVAAGTADEPDACVSAGASALVEQIQGMSHVPQPHEGAMPGGGSAQASGPTIRAYVRPGSDYSQVWGDTSPGVTVKLRILRGGTAIVERSKTSDGGGRYTFTPGWYTCPDYGYEWVLRRGDVVEVTASGVTARTTVVAVSAWVDPDADTVEGMTEPGRTVFVELWEYSDPCLGAQFHRTVGTAGDGSFVASFGATVDLSRRAFAEIHARDADGNSTYTSAYAYRLYSEFGHSSFQGYLKPGVAWTATLRRLGSTVALASGASRLDGYYDGYFFSPIEPGDVIAVSTGSLSMELTTTEIDLTVDPDADQISGMTGAGRMVRAYVDRRAYNSVLSNGCSYEWNCASAIADGSGSFTLHPSMDVRRGDEVAVTVYDDEGNYQYRYGRNAAAIVAQPGSGLIQGYWGRPGPGYVDVVLFTASGSPIAAESGVWVDSWDGEFGVFTSPVWPGYTIEVSDDAATETMVVQDHAARLDGGTGHLTGRAADGLLVAQLSDHRRETPSWYAYCVEESVSGGAYDLVFPGAQVGGQDYARAWASGPDGHYTRVSPHAFTVNVEPGDGYIWGYAESPLQPVDVAVERGGAPVASDTAHADYAGWFGAFASPILPEDVVRVDTAGGDSAAVPVPELTAVEDPVGNRIHGTSPGSEPVTVQLRKASGPRSYSYHSRVATADAAGNYSVSFEGLHFYDNGGATRCFPAQVGECTWPALSYYDAAGHSVSIEGAPPPPVDPDAYEGDDDVGSANAYVAPQAHTFHQYGDRDWVSLAVPPEDVAAGRLYEIETRDLGFGMDTVLDLYDQDGFTQLDYDDDSGVGYASLIRWQPPAAGVYYVRVRPYSDGHDTAYCDAVYALYVRRYQVFLPIVLRE